MSASYPFQFANVAALEAIGNAAGMTVQVAWVFGEHAGMYEWSAASTATPVSGRVIQVTGIATGRFVRNMSAVYSLGVYVLSDLFASDQAAAVACDANAAAADSYVELDWSITLTANFVATAPWRKFGGPSILTREMYTVTGDFWAPPGIDIFDIAGTGAITLTGHSDGYLEFFGADNSGTNDSAAAIGNGLSSVPVLYGIDGIYKIGSTVSVPQNGKIYGVGERITTFNNTGISSAFATPVSTPGGPKSYAQGFFNVHINGVSSSSPAAPAVVVQQTGNTYWEKCILENHATALQLEGSVGASLSDVTLNNCGAGLSTLGINQLDAVTTTTMNRGSISLTTNAIAIGGITEALHFNDTIFESNTNVYSETVGGPLSLVFRNVWFEDNTYYDFGTANCPLFDSSYFTGDISITGGFAPRFRDTTIRGSTNYTVFNVSSEIADIDATGVNWNVEASAHGMSFTVPTIGAVSTPIDRQGAQESIQSALFMNVGGTLSGSSVGFENLLAGGPGSGIWGNGAATVTLGQTDVFGGTSAALVNGVNSGSTAYIETIGLTTVVGQWYCFQLVIAAQSAGNAVSIWAQTSGTLDKRLTYELPDTQWRVLHMFFKADATTTYLFFFHGGGCYVHRIVLAEGAVLRPFIPYSANIPSGFNLQFDNVITYGTAAPTTGTWRVGDKVINSAPTASGYIGWVCTTAGTPGTWKTYGAISA